MIAMDERRQQRIDRLQRAERGETDDLQDYPQGAWLEGENVDADWIRGLDMSDEARLERHKRRNLEGFFYMALWVAIPGGLIAAALLIWGT